MKWGCIQPLTGGMYIGARNAIGNDRLFDNNDNNL